MAPVVWTSERVARLFRLVIGDLKVDYDKIARLWSQKYRKLPFAPTPYLHERKRSLITRSGRRLQTDSESHQRRDCNFEERRRL